MYRIFPELTYLLRYALLIAFLFIPSLSQASECDSKLVDLSNYKKTLKLLKGAYRNDDFRSVDDALSCLLTTNRKFPSGKSGAIAVYWFFRKEMRAPGVDEEDTLRINRWKKAVADSTFTTFAELRFGYSQAWNERGSKYANETHEARFKRFRTKLLETEERILSTGGRLKETPIYYNLLLAVTLDTRGTQVSATDVFSYGVTHWPNYYDFYEVVLTRLVPKWGGSWKHVDKFIEHWAISLKSQEANSIYARLYYSVHKTNRIAPQKTLVDWQKMKWC